MTPGAQMESSTKPRRSMGFSLNCEEILLACSLTCAFAVCLEGAFPSDGFPHVVAGGGTAVLRPGGPWADRRSAIGQIP